MFEVKLLDEHNPEGTLKLLNSHKRNLPILLSQYKNIIKTYLAILGMRDLILADANEVILPEIENLLRRYDYNCEFTNTGISSNGAVKFSVNGQKIEIQNGENYCTISAGILECGLRGLFLSKKITDFSNLGDKDKRGLTQYAELQIDPRNIKGRCFFKFPLKSIFTMSSISGGVELSKVILESYECSKSSTKDVCIKQTFSINEHAPTIYYDFDTFKFECLKEKNLTSEEYLSYLRDITYNINAVPFNAQNNECHEELFNSGKLSLYYGLSYRVIQSDNNYPTCLSTELSSSVKKNLLSELAQNLKEYGRKYGKQTHPLYFFMSGWRGELAQNVQSYLQKSLDNEIKADMLIRTS